MGRAAGQFRKHLTSVQAPDAEAGLYNEELRTIAERVWQMLGRGAGRIWARLECLFGWLRTNFRSISAVREVQAPKLVVQ